MTIRKNIEDIQKRIQNDSQFGIDLKKLAVKAIYGGMQNGKASPDWVAYMREFAKTPKELARLTDETTDCDDYIRSARAYLVGNGVCLPVTEGNLLGGIDDVLDITMDDNQADDYR